MAANAACKALKAPILASLRLARETLEALGDSLSIAKKAFRVAERALNVASRELRDVSVGLEHVKRRFREGLQVVAKITNFGLNRLFAIEEITFQASLGNAASGRFSLSVQAIILDQTVNVSLSTADINNIHGTITRPLANRIGFDSVVNRIG